VVLARCRSPTLAMNVKQIGRIVSSSSSVVIQSIPIET
jgi:hypothetical protein